MSDAVDQNIDLCEEASKLYTLIAHLKTFEFTNGKCQIKGFTYMSNFATLYYHHELQSQAKCNF